MAETYYSQYFSPPCMFRVLSTPSHSHNTLMITVNRIDTILSIRGILLRDQQLRLPLPTDGRVHATSCFICKSYMPLCLVILHLAVTCDLTDLSSFVATTFLRLRTLVSLTAIVPTATACSKCPYLITTLASLRTTSAKKLILILFKKADGCCYPIKFVLNCR